MLRLIDTEKMRQTKAVKELGVTRQAATSVFRSYAEKPPIASSRGGRENVKKRFTLNSLKQ